MESNRIPTPPAARSTPAPRGRPRIAAIARAAGRSCSRSGCDTPAAATLIFSYHEQVARLVELLDEREPQAYDLCPRHADRTTPPRGWDMSDARVPRSDAPRRMDDVDTVAVLAAALRGEAPVGRVTLVEADDDPIVEPIAEPIAEPIVDEYDDADTYDEYDDLDTYHGGYPLEDPLRAALEEVQRVVEPDASTPTGILKPLRPEDDLTLW